MDWQERIRKQVRKNKEEASKKESGGSKYERTRRKQVSKNKEEASKKEQGSK